MFTDANNSKVVPCLNCYDDVPCSRFQLIRSQSPNSQPRRGLGNLGSKQPCFTVLECYKETYYLQVMG